MFVCDCRLCVAAAAYLEREFKMADSSCGLHVFLSLGRRWIKAPSFWLVPEPWTRPTTTATVAAADGSFRPTRNPVDYCLARSHDFFQFFLLFLIFKKRIFFFKCWERDRRGRIELKKEKKKKKKWENVKPKNLPCHDVSASGRECFSDRNESPAHHRN